MSWIIIMRGALFTVPVEHTKGEALIERLNEDFKALKSDEDGCNRSISILPLLHSYKKHLSILVGHDLLSDRFLDFDESTVIHVDVEEQEKVLIADRIDDVRQVLIMRNLKFTEELGLVLHSLE